MNYGYTYFYFLLDFDKMQRNNPIENNLPNCMHSYFIKPDMQIF